MSDQTLPIWIRVPEAVRITGLSRSKIYELMAEGKIRNASLKTGDMHHACRVIDRADLLRFIDSFATGGCA